METLIPVLERLVPLKGPRSGKRNRVDRKRKLLWRKLRKVQRKIEMTSSASKLSTLIQDKWDLETQLKSDYSATNCKEEDQAILNIKQNPKAFFSFARSRQKTRTRIGPFLDPVSGHPNPDPDFAASVLSDQYKSVFVEPRSEWKVDNASEFFAQQNASDIPDFSEIPFTEMDMEIACSELSSSSAAGADGVPASLLKF